MKILVIGGGIGGLCLAQALRKAGTDVTVFERQGSESENLAGYGIHINSHGQQALRNALPEAGWRRFCETSTSAGTDLFFRDERLGLLARRDDAMLSGRPPAEIERRGIGRIELRDILLDGLMEPDEPVVEWDKTFTRYEELPDGRVRAHFADGSAAEGDVLVGADASHSAVRQQRLPAVVREDLGRMAIAGRFILDDARVRALPAFLTNGSLNNVAPVGKGWMFFSSWHSRPGDVGGQHQEPQHYVVWAYIVPRPETPPARERLGPEELRSIVLERIRGWSPTLQRLVAEADPATIAPVVLRSMPHLSPWQSSAVTLLGDAIHNMTPLAGIGANTALRDADLLSGFLVEADRGERSLPDAIATYEDRMRGYANDAVGASRRNAERASAVSPVGRRVFRLVLRLANAFPAIMRATVGRDALKTV